MVMDLNKIRSDFPVLQTRVKGKPIIYFDNACVTLRPVQVIEAINSYYQEFPACAARSLHKLGTRATEGYEKARKGIARFIGARPEEIIFTKNTTEGINLVAHGLAWKAGDCVLTSDKEHNSNLLPWLHLVKVKGIRHEIVQSNPDNTFSLKAFEERVKGLKPRLVSLVHTSNLDGITNPVREIIKIAHDAGSLVLLDGAQSVPHKPIDVGKLGMDFLAFSGHKMCGPSGIGILYVRRDVIERLEPFALGGETVINSTYTSYELDKSPGRFEPGLQHYAGAIGLAAAAKYLEGIGLENIEKHEIELNKIITKGIEEMGIEVIGPKNPELRGGILSFNIPKIAFHDVAVMLDELANIAVRSGQHCVHSWFNAHGLKGSVRASLYLYNTKEEAQVFLETLKSIMKLR